MNSSISNSNGPFPGHGSMTTLLRWWLKPAALAVTMLVAGSLLLRIVNSDFPAPSFYSRIRQSIGTDTEMLVIGNSLVIYGIQPSQFSRHAVNLAVHAGHYEVFDIVMRRNIDRCPNLKWVLIQLDNLCYLDDRMSQNRDHGPLYDLGVKRQDLVNCPWEYVRQFLMDNPVMYPVFFMPRLTPTSLWLADDAPLYQEPGFLAYGFQMSDHILSQRDLTHDEYLLQSNRKEANWTALVRIIHFLRNRDIQIAFLRLPRLQAYSATRSMEWTTTEETLVQDVRKHGGDRMILLDYRDAPWLSPAHFFDTRHLNNMGAKIFTRHLDGDLRKHFKEYAPSPASSSTSPDQTAE